MVIIGHGVTCSGAGGRIDLRDVAGLDHVHSVDGLGRTRSAVTSNSVNDILRLHLSLEGRAGGFDGVGVGGAGPCSRS